MLPPAPPPDAQPPRSGLARWLDRHAYPGSRIFRCLDLARAVTQVLTVAGLIALVVQLHQANITARRDAHNRSDKLPSSLSSWNWPTPSSRVLPWQRVRSGR